MTSTKKKKKNYKVREKNILTYIGIALLSVVLFIGLAYLTWVLVAPAVDHANFSDTLKTKDGWLVPYNWFVDLF